MPITELKLQEFGALKELRYPWVWFGTSEPGSLLSLLQCLSSVAV